MKSVYLAGPITGLSFGGCTEWRDYAISKLAPHGIQGLSPMRGKHYLANLKSISGTGEEYKDAGVLSTQSAVVARDRFDTQRCDVVLMNMVGAERISIGTMIEIGWADSARRPVVMAIEANNVHQHMMVRGLIGFMVPTLDEALATVISILAERQ